MTNVMATIALQNLGVDMEDEQKRKVWWISDDNQADWALDKIRGARAEYRRFEMAVNDKIAQLQEALAREREAIEKETGFFEHKLMEYFETVQKKTTKTQETYKLPSGRLVKKYKSPKIARDDVRLVEWLEGNGMDDLIKVKKFPNWAELKKDSVLSGSTVVHKPTGEIIDGITAIKQAPEFKVEV